MPHYENGIEAKVGDVVIGRGYNHKFNLVPKDGPHSEELVGVVVNVRPGDSCTLTVAYVEVTELPEKLDRWQIDTYRHALIISPMALYVQTEYGDTKGFRKVGS